MAVGTVTTSYVFSHDSGLAFPFRAHLIVTRTEHNWVVSFSDRNTPVPRFTNFRFTNVRCNKPCKRIPIYNLRTLFSLQRRTNFRPSAERLLLKYELSSTPPSLPWLKP
jgi:hypothetical protein